VLRRQILARAQLGPDEEREVCFALSGTSVTKFPGDYRSRGRVDREAAETAEELK
jgi:hypothetical protein